jgi:hypothetical protein
MPYLNIVFHNTQHGGLSINQTTSRQDYTVNFVAAANVFQTSTGPGATAAAVGGAYGLSGAWGACVTWWPTATSPAGANAASGIFLCESPAYDHPDYTYWNGHAPALPAMPSSAIPVFPNSHVLSGYTPFVSLNTLCAFLYGRDENHAIGVTGVVPAVIASGEWIHSPNQALACLGTGAAPLLNHAAPWGSDRYGILFQASHRTYPNGDAITGVFVHTKNTDADPGTQIASLCRHFLSSIIFGDLNLNLRNTLARDSLAYAIGATHTILAIQSAPAGPYYYTRYDAHGAGTACLDFALIPNAHITDVELWAHRPGAAVTLSRHHSDHSVMMLRIQCT